MIRFKQFLTGSSVNFNPERSFTFGPVHYDQNKGIGAVPNNSNVNYLGFAVLMKAIDFLYLVPQSGKSVEEFKQLLNDYKPIASPFLDLDLRDIDNPRVKSHEGRHRVKAIAELYGQNTMVVVHMFILWGGRAHNITLNDIRKVREKMVPEQRSSLLYGPHFASKVWHKGQWHDI